VMSSQPLAADYAEQARRYEERGYVIVQDLFTPSQVETMQGRIVDIAEGRVPEFPAKDVEFESGDSNVPQSKLVRKINRCAENDKVFFELAGNPATLDVVEALIGPDIKLFGSQCFMKPPGGVEKPYHQDSAYFTIEPLSLVTCWIALDNVTEENGCMWVIPGSQRGDLFDHSQPWEVGGRTDMQVPDDKIDRSQEAPIHLTPGSCSFHHSKLLHRSGPNHSDRPRRGLAIHYMSAQSRWTDSQQPQPDYPLLRGQAFPGCV